MKIKSILFIKIMFLMIQKSGAQNYYIKALTGYGFRIPGQTYESEIDHKFSYYSLGKGFQLGGGIGYRFRNNLAFEMNLNYINSKDYNVSNYRDIESNVLQLMPAFTLHHKISPKSTFTSGFGPIIGIYTKLREVNDYSEMKLSGGKLPFGAFAQLAYNYSFTERFYAIAEMRISALSYTPLKGEMTKYERNGADKLDSLPTNLRFEEYDENWSSNNSDPNVPSKYHFNSYNYSNVSLQIGFGYRFIKNDESIQNDKYKKKKKRK